MRLVVKIKRANIMNLHKLTIIMTSGDRFTNIEITK